MQTELTKYGVLTQQEIDSLLGPSAVTDSLRDLGAIPSQCRSVASNFSTVLSSLLRANVMIESGLPENLAYRAVAKHIETPFCYSLLQSDAWNVPGMLVIDGRLVLPILGRLLGATGDLQTPLERSLSDIEANLMRRVLDSFLIALRREWDAAFPTDLRLTRVDSGGQLPSIVPLHQQSAVICFQVEWGNLHGALYLCLPWSFVETLKHLQKPNSSETSVAERGSPLFLADAIGLEVGDYLTTNVESNGQFIVSINGQPYFYAVEEFFEGERALKLVARLESSV